MLLVSRHRLIVPLEIRERLYLCVCMQAWYIVKIDDYKSVRAATAEGPARRHHRVIACIRTGRRTVL